MGMQPVPAGLGRLNPPVPIDREVTVHSGLRSATPMPCGSFARPVNRLRRTVIGG